MVENYDDYYRKKKEDYLKTLAQKERAEAELLNTLEYHRLLDYYGLGKLRYATEIDESQEDRREKNRNPFCRTPKVN